MKIKTSGLLSKSDKRRILWMGILWMGVMLTGAIGLFGDRPLMVAVAIALLGIMFLLRKP
jgi:hypothetical protein